jgi:hypothetical protein
VCHRHDRELSQFLLLLNIEGRQLLRFRCGRSVDGRQTPRRSDSAHTFTTHKRMQKKEKEGNSVWEDRGERERERELTDRCSHQKCRTRISGGARAFRSLVFLKKVQSNISTTVRHSTPAAVRQPKRRGHLMIHWRFETRRLHDTTTAWKATHWQGSKADWYMLRAEGGGNSLTSKCLHTGNFDELGKGIEVWRRQCLHVCVCVCV